MFSFDSNYFQDAKTIHKVCK